MHAAFEDYIGIHLRNAHLTIANCIKHQLLPYQLAPEQNLIMLLLWKQDGWNQNEIAEKLNKDKTNIARMLLNLEQKGFVRRVVQSEDRRYFNVYVTENGKKLEEQVIPIIEEANRQFCKDIDEQELKEFLRILSKIRTNASTAIMKKKVCDGYEK
ncbi:MarR family transcriptional regulator [Paenibacillus sp. SYP-B3998]|uniref:MarR family transcriptional regulator n=2 Tax=Paenibacillus sp. SYP-B3998 TaxID=2678564 RepID=A0A6G4A5T4_9BACL|nr:MarR family transcriptional regulator [Paenibacillus sp. SYP-B3998]